MPVKKYRHVNEMEGNTWHEPGDPRLFEAIRAVWALVDRTTRPRFPPGVYRHRSLEEAEIHQQAWDQASFEAYRTRLRNGRRGGRGER